MTQQLKNDRVHTLLNSSLGQSRHSSINMTNAKCARHIKT